MTGTTQVVLTTLMVYLLNGWVANAAFVFVGAVVWIKQQLTAL